MPIATALEAFATLAALAAALYVLVCALVAQRFTRARRKRPQLQRQHPVLDGLQVQFTARDGRARIDAWYLAAKPRRGAVIFVHGKDACRGDELKSPTLELADHLNLAGLSVLMIDLRGHGSSSDARLTYSEHERHDVLGAVDFLVAQGYARGTIGVLGASMGGTIAMRAAAEEPAIGAVIADTPFADFATMMRSQFRKLSGLPMCFLPGALLGGRWLTGIDFANLAPVRDVHLLRGRPVLVIHSLCDPFIGLSQGVAMAEAALAELWVTRSTRHIGSYAAAPEIYTEVVSVFFRRHLLGQVFGVGVAANDSCLDALTAAHPQSDGKEAGGAVARQLHLPRVSARLSAPTPASARQATQADYFPAMAAGLKRETLPCR